MGRKHLKELLQRKYIYFLLNIGSQVNCKRFHCPFWTKICGVGGGYLVEYGDGLIFTLICLYSNLLHSLCSLVIPHCFT